MTAGIAVSGDIFHLSLVLPLDVAQRLASLLEERFDEAPPAVSLHERKGEVLWGLDAYFEAPPDLELIGRLVAEVAPGTPLHGETLPPTDWVSIVQSELSPVAAGRFFVYGSHDRARASGRAGDIEIDAGQAFGTAHHGTTEGCLRALDLLLKRHRFSRVLDLGTGTGLLAIAVAKSLRQPVLASDIDPIAVRVAAENARQNGAARLVRVVVAEGMRHPLLQRQAPYDLLIANILAAPLLQLAPMIAAATRKGSRLVLSGLLREQASSIEARYRCFGFIAHRRLPIDEWTTLILERR